MIWLYPDETGSKLEYSTICYHYLTMDKELEALSHRAPTQTAPEIFACHIVFKHGFESARCRFHQWALAYTISGYCFWNHDEGNFTVESGDLLIIRPHTHEAWRAGGPKAAPPRRGTARSLPKETWETAYAVFHPRAHWLAWLDALEYQSGFARLHYDAEASFEVEESLLTTARTYNNGGPYRDLRTLAALEMALLTMLVHGEPKVEYDDRVRQAEKFMQVHYAEPIALRDMAREVGLSASHFAYLFAAVTGIPPVAYLERIRFARATEMLRFSTHGIAEIARVTGFTDPNYFAYRFRLNFGQTPSEYRASSRP